MKNTLILHGTGSTSQDNWFPWLKHELEKNSFKVWVPDLPNNNFPSISRWNKHIFNNKDWHFNQDSILVGHSAGAIEILGLLQALPKDIKVDSCFLVGSFKNDLGWEQLKDLFIKPFDFELIKPKANKFILFHSDDDPHCPLDHAQYLTEKLDGELIMIPNKGHLSGGTVGDIYNSFPELLELITKRT